MRLKYGRVVSAVPEKGRKRAHPNQARKHVTRATSASVRKSPPTRDMYKALKEIQDLQKNTDLQIRRAPFNRLVRELAKKFSTEDTEFRFQATAVEALQEAAESELVKRFQKWNLYAIHAKRVTIQVKDIYLDEGIMKIEGLQKPKDPPSFK